jgi:dolichol kinase
MPAAACERRLATRKTVSWPRKLFHLAMISTVGLTLGLVPELDRTSALLILGVLAAIVGGLDILRLAVPSLNARVLEDFRAIIRLEEKHGLSASTWFLGGALLTVGYAPRAFAAVALLCLAAGDPVASWVGVRFGRMRLPGGKSLEGSLALVLTCAAVGTIFLGLTHALPWGIAPLVAIGGAFAAALAEWLPVRFVDDNFRVPVATAAALTGLAGALAPHVTA